MEANSIPRNQGSFSFVRYFGDEEVGDDSCLPLLNVRSLSNTETEDCVVPPAPALNLQIDEIIIKILQLVKDRSNKISDIKVREEMKESLKCMVCFETKPNFVQFCKNCRRYLGCFPCSSNLQDCPQCRKPLYKLNCPTCDSDYTVGDSSIVYTKFT